MEQKPPHEYHSLEELEPMLRIVSTEFDRLNKKLKEEEALGPRDQFRFDIVTKQKKELQESIDRLNKKGK